MLCDSLIYSLLRMLRKHGYALWETGKASSINVSVGPKNNSLVLENLNVNSKELKLRRILQVKPPSKNAESG